MSQTYVLKEGDTAPDFSMDATNGRHVSLQSLKGQAFVLYFYPKADTPGCTKEACAFNDALQAFDKTGLNIIGVSRDPMKKLESFSEKYGLAFPLASDADGQVTEAYGTWVEKSLYGKTYMGIERTTFLINAEGKIARIWHKVKVDGHADAVVEAVSAL
ncbi:MULTISPECIES: thioredoxin-dependent thiol peroxidase [Acetobacter]|uniref:thioredoxin-dependent thiol peroxidase n=1 Tax=Acetobacter TaxID=434 RepID=UPI000A38AC7F|nr:MULTISPECIES: thioredoxin-dependent thiol peroxidase [Acetobacter]MBS0979370.1 thioredoxin-dependent thiol peroxidase [Acetobacter thailandicus]MBS0985574.1 thioredoxin-dependent thiol peroxidase [Acetobacter thailandicus]OUI88583.1 bacterioferritin [Acetobacter sp. DmW_043]